MEQEGPNNGDNQNGDNLHQIGDVDNQNRNNVDNQILHLQARQYLEHVAALNAIAEAEQSFLGTIDHLNLQNRKLEQKINEADGQNNLLQMQLKVLTNKMENLESFMLTLNSLDEDSPRTNCPRCGFQLKNLTSLRRSESFDREVYGDLLPTEATMLKFRSKLLTSDIHIKNPMMIDLIIAKVMGHLDTPTLLSCRQVNHLWNNEACYELRQKHVFKLTSENVHKIHTFLANPSSSSCLFTRLKVDVGFVLQTFRSELEEFFEIYGPSVTHLSISCEEEFASRIYTEEFRMIISHLSQIEELELNLPTKITERQSIYEDIRPRNRFLFSHLKSIVFHQFDSSGGYSVWFTKEMLKMAPNLQSLRVETHSKEVITRILLALGDRECRSLVSELRHLFLDAYVTQQHLEMLGEFDFHLKSLQLSYLTVEVGKEMVEALLNRHSKSLTTLVMGDYQKRPSQANLPLTIRLPVMSCLSQLKFVDPCFPSHRNLILSPLSYSVQLPKLRRLVFDHEKGKPSGVHLFSDLFNQSPTPCSSLRELKITHGLTEVAVVHQMAKMFGNLIKLEVANVPDIVLREIWDNFTDIEELRVELCPANVNVDSMLTGIPMEVCRKIQERNLYYQVDALDVLDIIRTEPSICNLTKLRTLRIDGLPSTLLTAVSGYLALSLMKSLTTVSIKSDVATLSRECQRVLGERLPLTLFELY